MYVPFDDAGALTPFADFFNYAAPPAPVTPLNSHIHFDLPTQNAHEAVYLSSSDEYVFIAKCNYKKNEQVFLNLNSFIKLKIFMCYGCYNNLDLIQNYGFLLVPNPHDNFNLKISDLKLSDKIMMDLKSNNLNRVEKCFIHANGSPSWELLKLLRLNYYAHKNVKLSKNEKSYIICGNRLSIGSDIDVLHHLKNICIKLNVQFETKVIDDEVVLSNEGNLNVMEIMALKWRHHQKLIIENCMELCDLNIKLLENQNS